MDPSFLKDKVFQYLTPPGNGVHTVHTAKENKESLHQRLYQTTNTEIVEKKWQESFKSFKQDTRPCLLGITSDTGGGIQRGANWGPLFIREQLDHNDFFDIGDIKTIPHLLHDSYLNKQTIQRCQKALYPQAPHALPVSPLSITEDFCHHFYQEFPHKKILALGGDHSVSYALVKPWVMAKKQQGIKTAIIHFDAHTDLMSERLGIDICFASWAYHMIELLDQPDHLIQLGLRSSGQPKDYWENKYKIKQYWANEIIQNERQILDNIIDHLKKNSVEELYLSFDIDALDIEYASATGTPESGGLSPHSCCYIIQQLGEQFKITGGDVVEVAPFVKSPNESKLSPGGQTTLLSAKLITNKIKEAMN